ncbi:hypothetical protein GW17_00031521 [Ensete ventricosum]|nr:hypothetical protein GW17_00031521 [Ensete ventricosum]
MKTRPRCSPWHLTSTVLGAVEDEAEAQGCCGLGPWVVPGAAKDERLTEARRKLSKVRQRSRATMAWVPRLFLALPRTRQKHKTIEAWVPGLFLVISRMWRRHRTIKAWVPRLFLVLSRMRRRHRTIEAWVPGLSLGTAKDDAEAQGWCNLGP